MGAAPVSRIHAEFFKAMGHPLRVAVLELLCSAERSVTELQEHLSVKQPALSQQLGVLRRARLVVARHQGSHVIYTLADERIATLLLLSRAIQHDRMVAIGDGLTAP